MTMYFTCILKVSQNNPILFIEEHKNRQGEVAAMKIYKNLIFDHHFLEFIFLPALCVE